MCVFLQAKWESSRSAWFGVDDFQELQGVLQVFLQSAYNIN